MANEWETVVASGVTAIVAVAGTLLGVWLTSRHNRENLRLSLRYQKLYNLQADVLIEINKKLCDMEQAMVEMTREFLHLQSWTHRSEDIHNAHGRLLTTSNELNELILYEEAYIPSSLMDIIWLVQKRLREIPLEMSKATKEDFEQKLELWNKLVNEDWPSWRKRWINEYRRFLSGEAHQGGKNV